jgi:hypothetical protein
LPPELVHSELPAGLQQRLTRMMFDTRMLGESLTPAQRKSAYSEIEAIRDALSRLLDKADNKNA